MCCRGEGRFVGWTGFPFLVRPWTSLGYLSVSTSLSAAFRSIFRRGRPPLFPWAGFVFHDVSPLPSFRASQILPWEGRRGRAIQPPDDLLGLCLIRSSPLPIDREFLLPPSPSPWILGVLLPFSHPARGRDKPGRKQGERVLAQREGRSGKGMASLSLSSSPSTTAAAHTSVDPPWPHTPPPTPSPDARAWPNKQLETCSRGNVPHAWSHAPKGWKEDAKDRHR